MMKKTIFILGVIFITLLAIGMYNFNYPAGQSGEGADCEHEEAYDDDTVNTLSDSADVVNSFDASTGKCRIGLSVNLSPKAQKALAGQKETYIVSVSITGTPLDAEKYKGSETYGEKFGQLYLGAKRCEANIPSSFLITDADVNPALYKDIDMETLNVLVNVFSGRRASENNILDCGIIDGHPRNILPRNIIDCRLINEN